MIKKIYNTIKQWSVVRWCTKWVAWCFRWLCFIARSSWRFFMKHILDRLLISIIFVGGVIMLALAVRLFWKVLPIWRNGSELKNSYDLLQPLIWSIGGVGAAIGLWFANQRQKTLSEQVQTQVEQAQAQTDQSFNDRLGRGVELLADEKNVSMRSAGIRILVDLAHNATRKQKPIVANIIFDFFHDKTVGEERNQSPLSKKATISAENRRKDSSTSKKKSRQDVQNALDFLISVPIDEREKLYPNWLVDGRLDFCNLDFSYLNFSHKTLKKIDFSHSYFYKTEFNNADIESVKIFRAAIDDASFHNAKIKKVGCVSIYIEGGIFSETQIANSSFTSGEIRKSTFSSVILKKVNFSGLNFISTDIKNSEIVDVEFCGVKFEQGIFESKNEIRVSSKDSLPHFTSTDLGLTMFDFDGGIKPSDFFELCYYGAEQKSTKMDASRKYYTREGWGNVFVESDERWSGKPLNGWGKLERAAIETEKRDAEEYRMRMAEEAAENMPEPEYQQPPHPIEEADQFLKREIESLKRFNEKQKKPKPKAKKPKPKPKKP